MVVARSEDKALGEVYVFVARRWSKITLVQITGHRQCKPDSTHVLHSRRWSTSLPPVEHGGRSPVHLRSWDGGYEDRGDGIRKPADTGASSEPAGPEREFLAACACTLTNTSYAHAPVPLTNAS